MIKEKQLCSDCKFIMQTTNSMVCGHSHANKKKNGNGSYIYPPAQWSCDIGKFERSEKTWQESMKETAKLNGWKKIKEENGISFYENINK